MSENFRRTKNMMAGSRSVENQLMDTNTKMTSSKEMVPINLQTPMAK